MALPNPWDYSEKNGSEHSHQAALFMWANMTCRFGLAAANFKEAYTVAGWAKAHAGTPIWQLKWLHAIHNQGHGDAIRGAHAKAEGVKPGVSDIFLPFPIYKDFPHDLKGGLYIELKIGNNQPSDIQLEFQANMRHIGYCCEIAWGWLEARDKILDYLGLPRYTAAIYKVEG